MTDESNKKDAWLAFILIIQFSLILIPFGLSALQFAYNPSYMLRLIEPGRQQPIGWLFTAILILIFGFLIGLSWKIADGWKRRIMIKNFFLLFVFLVLDCLFFSALLLSPALLLLLTSPVGKMFFGA
jgi:hypothetical protein